MKFKVGDKVKLIQAPYGHESEVRLINYEGIVVHIRTDLEVDTKDIGVEYDQTFAGGHNCEGHGKDGHCWYARPEDLGFLDNTQPLDTLDRVIDTEVRRLKNV